MVSSAERPHSSTDSDFRSAQLRTPGTDLRRVAARAAARRAPPESVLVGVIGFDALLVSVGMRVHHVVVAVLVLVLEVLVLVRTVRVRVGHVAVRVLVTMRLRVGVLPTVDHGSPFRPCWFSEGEFGVGEGRSSHWPSPNHPQGAGGYAPLT